MTTFYRKDGKNVRVYDFAGKQTGAKKTQQTASGITGDENITEESTAPKSSKGRRSAVAAPASIGSIPHKVTAPVAQAHIEPKIHTVSAEEHRPFPISAVFIALICTVLFMFMIYNLVQINEYTVTVTELRNQLADLQEEEKSLSFQLEKRNDLRVIEELAQKLGMVKLDQVSKQYVTVEGDDKIETYDTAAPENHSDVFGNIMSSLGQYFSDIG